MTGDSQTLPSTTVGAAAPSTSPSDRPPMGWNSWDCYGTTVTEREVLANGRFMAEHLAPYGWDTVVVDIDWSDPTARSHGYNDAALLAMDDYGRLVPDEGRFPSAADGEGFAPLAREIHALGLRFGIHVMRGIPKLAVERNTPILGADGTRSGWRARDVAAPENSCEWNPDMYGLDQSKPGARAYYDSVLALYAEWGVDFLKVDDMLWPYQETEIEAFADAIRDCGRAIELSLSPGRDLSLTRLPHLRDHATMWRICDDLWDDWEQVKANFARFARWAPFAGPEGWPDGDMLPLGAIGLRAERGEPRDDLLTPPERRSLMTLWVIARSPLMIGGDLPATDTATISLFTNAEVLEILHSARDSREVFREDPLILWTAGSEKNTGVRYVAAFNVGEAMLPIALDAQDVGLPATIDGELRELWTGTAVETRDVDEQSDAARGVAPGSTAIDVAIPAHGAVLLRYTPSTA